jgi:hypothetical protein
LTLPLLLVSLKKEKRDEGAELVYLGHIIGSSGVKIDSEKTKSVREWTTPKALTEVRSFLPWHDQLPTN